MAVGTGTVLAGGALLGAFAGSMGKESSQTISRALGPAGQLERQAGQISQEQLEQLSDLVGAGAGKDDVIAGAQSQRDLATMLEQFAGGGFNPNAQDFELASQLFAPQQTALNQQFEQQSVEANRLAAQLGRPINDPVLQAKLAQNQMNQQQMLNSQITQQAAQNPMQRLNFQQGVAQVRGGLATQAMQNRQALLGLGKGVMGQQQQFRLGAAPVTQTSTSGGGLGGAIAGGLAGAGFGMQAASGLQSMGFLGGGGGNLATGAPMPSTGQSYLATGSIA